MRNLARAARHVLASIAAACALIAISHAADAADAAGAPAAQAAAPSAAPSTVQKEAIRAWFAVAGADKPDLAAIGKQLDAHPELAQAWSPQDPDQPWYLPSTALHLAVMSENRALAQLLIDHHAVVDAENRFCPPPLMWSSPKMGAWLIEKGAHPTIYWYANANDAVALKALLAKQPGLARAWDRQHVSALSWAANGCALETATALLAGGADPNTLNDWEQTPLDMAVGWDDEASRKPERQKLVDLLVGKGAQWDARAAALHGKLDELTHELDLHPDLLKKHYRPDSGDGAMLIHFACAGNHQDCVELLIKRGMDINATDAAGTTPLHDACVHGSALVSWLLAHGANASLHEKHYGADPRGWAQYFGNKGAIAAFDAVAAAAKQAAKAKAAEKATGNF